MDTWFDAASHAEQGATDLESGRFADAAAHLSKAVEQQPLRDDWRVSLGIALEALERFEEAIEHYAAAASRVDDVELCLRLGVNKLRLGHGQEAIDAFEKAGQLDPERVESYDLRIIAYTRLGDFEQAELMFYMSQQVLAENAGAFDYMAQSLVLKGDVHAAIDCWRQCLEIDPHYSDAHLSLARVLWHVDKPKSAAKHLRLHLKENPTDAEARQELGMLLLDLKRPDLARRELMRAVTRDDSLAVSWVALGDLATDENKPDRACRCYRRALEADANITGAAMSLARIELTRGHRESACDLLREELQRPGQTRKQTLDLARLLNKAEMFEQTVELLTPLIAGLDDLFYDDERGMAVALIERAKALQTLGDDQVAESDWRRAWSLEIKCKAPAKALIRLYTRQGRHARAAVVARQFAAIHPDDTQAIAMARAAKDAHRRSIFRRPTVRRLKRAA